MLARFGSNLKCFLSSCAYRLLILFYFIFFLQKAFKEKRKSIYICIVDISRDVPNYKLKTKAEEESERVSHTHSSLSILIPFSCCCCCCCYDHPARPVSIYSLVDSTRAIGWCTCLHLYSFGILFLAASFVFTLYTYIVVKNIHLGSPLLG